MIVVVWPLDIILVAVPPELWKEFLLIVARSGYIPLPRTVTCFGAAAADMIFIGKILRSAIVPFSHGLSRSMITSVLPTLLVLKENNFLPDKGRIHKGQIIRIEICPPFEAGRRIGFKGYCELFCNAGVDLWFAWCIIADVSPRNNHD